MEVKESERVRRPVVSDSLRPQGLVPARLLCPWDSPGKNTAVGCHALLQGIFPTQGSNLGLLHCRRILHDLSHQGRNSHSHRLLMPRCLSLLGSLVPPGHFSWAVSFPRGLEVGPYPHSLPLACPARVRLGSCLSQRREGTSLSSSVVHLSLHPLLRHSWGWCARTLAGTSQALKGPTSLQARSRYHAFTRGINRKTDSPGPIQPPCSSAETSPITRLWFLSAY